MSTITDVPNEAIRRLFLRFILQILFNQEKEGG